MKFLKRLSVIPVIAALATSLLSTPITADAFAGNTLINIQSVDGYGHQVTGGAYQLLDSNGTMWAEWTSGNEDKATVTGGIYSVHSEAEMQYPTYIDYSLLGVDSSQVFGYTIKDASGNVTAQSDDITKSFQLFANTVYTCIAKVINNDWTADIIVPANTLYVMDKTTSATARERFPSIYYLSEYYNLNGTNMTLSAPDNSKCGYVISQSGMGFGFGYSKSTDTKAKVYTYNAKDTVFSDDKEGLQIATVSGSLSAGYTISSNIKVAI